MKDKNVPRGISKVKNKRMRPIQRKELERKQKRIKPVPTNYSYEDKLKEPVKK